MPENATKYDIDAAQSLLEEHLNGLNAMQDRGVNCVEAVAKYQLNFQTYNKYFLFNDVRKQVFQEVILVEGTKACVEEASEKDLTLTKEHITMRAWRFLSLLAGIEYPGTFYANGEIELVKQLHFTVRCPRATVRFFHRLISCDCLHEIYYKLKKTTQRTTFCINCAKAVDI